MTSNGGFFLIYILNENKTLWVVLHHFLFHSRVNLAFLPLNLPCWVFCFWFKSRLEVTPVCEGTRYHLKRSPRLFKTRPTLSNHQTAAPMWREFQHSGQFSIVTAQHTRVTEPFTGSPVYQKQSSTNEKFLRGLSSCKPDCSCMENMNQSLWSHSSVPNWWNATRRRGNCVIFRFNNEISNILISCWTEVCISCYGFVWSVFDAFPSENVPQGWSDDCWNLCSTQPVRSGIYFAALLFLTNRNQVKKDRSEFKKRICEPVIHDSACQITDKSAATRMSHMPPRVLVHEAPRPPGGKRRQVTHPDRAKAHPNSRSVEVRALSEGRWIPRRQL